MSFKGRMEPAAYDALRDLLRERIHRSVRRIENHARNGTLDQIRYHAGERDGFAMALMILEGKSDGIH